MLNSWKKPSNPLAMPKRIQDLDLSIEYIQELQSAGKSAKTITLGSKLLPEPMRSADILKLFDFQDMEPTPVVNKVRKKLWSAQKSSSKKRNERIKITANKENVRKSVFAKTSARRTSVMKTNAADQTLPLIDLEYVEKHPHKINQSLRIPQSTSNNKTTTSNSNAKRQSIYQTKIIKPIAKSNINSQNKINDRATVTGESKLKRQTVHQTRPAFKSIPEISVTNCNDSKDKSLLEPVGEKNDREPVYDILKQILCRMNKLEMLIQDKYHCTKCHALVSPCKHEQVTQTESELKNNTADMKQITNDAIMANQKGTEIIVENIVTESIKQTTENTVSEIINNNIQSTEKITENIQKDTEYDNKNSIVKNVLPLFTCNDEAMSIVNIKSEDDVANNQTVLQTENLIKPIELMAEKDTDVCTNFTLLNVTSDKTLHKSHFELLEAELENGSVTSSLALFDSDDYDSPVFQEINFDYLLGAKEGGDVTEINTVNDVTKLSASSTGSNDAIRTYNEMRKTLPLLCTPKVMKNNNASLFTPSVQNSHKKLLSRRIQEQLLMLNKK